MTGDVSVIIAVLSALGVGGIATYLVKWWLEGRKAAQTSTETAEAEKTSTLTGTALSLVTALDTQLTNARSEALAARQEAQEAHREVRDLRDRFDRIVRDESSWATRARDALAAQRWPAGLDRTPPILTLIPKG